MDTNQLRAKSLSEQAGYWSEELEVVAAGLHKLLPATGVQVMAASTFLAQLKEKLLGLEDEVVALGHLLLGKEED